MNFWRPKQIANDIWRAGNEDGDTGVSPLLAFWWAAFLISNLASNAAGRRSFSAETAAELQNAAAIYAFADLVDIVAAVLAICVVRAITARQASHTGQPLAQLGPDPASMPSPSVHAPAPVGSSPAAENTSSASRRRLLVGTVVVLVFVVGALAAMFLSSRGSSKGGASASVTPSDASAGAGGWEPIQPGFERNYGVGPSTAKRLRLLVSGSGGLYGVPRRRPTLTSAFVPAAGT